MPAELIVKIVTIIIAIISVIITYVLIPFIKQKVSAEKIQDIILWVGKAVMAAEQLFISIPKSGEQKKELVLKFIKEYLASKNIEMTDEQINLLIESAVAELNKAKQQLTTSSS